MKRSCFVCLLQCFATTLLLCQSNPSIDRGARVMSPISASVPDAKVRAKALDSYGKLPLSFEANQGQTDERVKFLSRTSRYTFFLTDDNEAVLAFRQHRPNRDAVQMSSTAYGAQSDRVAFRAGPVVRMKLRNANPAARVSGEGEMAGMSNYFIGNDPATWRTLVRSYEKVKYEGVYSGIDMVYHGNQGQVEYDFVVAPGADPRRIQIDVRGANRIRCDKHGDLVLEVEGGEIRWRRPVAYQGKNEARKEIGVRYSIKDKNRIRFEIAKHDSAAPLFIDPIIYSTYLGGSGGDGGASIAIDSMGYAYVTGSTYSADFPATNPAQATNGGVNDAFVAKLNPTGSALVYATYLGGSGGEVGYGVAVDNAGNAYVTGYTYSTDFPTVNALQPKNDGGNYEAFVAKLTPSGSSLVYATYLGGSGGDEGWGIAADSAGNAYIVGDTESNDFPTKHPLQPHLGGERDAFVAEINPSGSALVYSTYLGGSGGEIGIAIALDSANAAYVTGYVSSTDFPTVNALQPSTGGGSDAFLSKLNPAGSAFSYSTYLGGSQDDFGRGIAVDCAGNAYVTGGTVSSDFPTKSPLQPVYGGYQDAFVSKIDATGSAFIYSTFLGGRGEEVGYGIAADCSGNAYVTGATSSTDFPTASPLQKRRKAGGDAFLSKLNPAGSALFSSTYLGGRGADLGSGVAVDGSGYAYVTGTTYSTDFPTRNPMQPYGGSGDAFVAKIAMVATTTSTLMSSPNPSAYGQPVVLTAMLTSGAGAPPDGETIAFKHGTIVLGTGSLSDGLASFKVSTLKVGASSVKADYGGDSNFAGSVSKPVTQVVNQASTTTVLASSQNPSIYGQSVTFTATVAPQFGGKVTGKVTFSDGAAALKTVALNGGVATLTTSTLATGTHGITATYSGNTSFSSSSATLTQTVK